MNDDTRRRQRAAELAVAQVQVEVRKVSDEAEEPLASMSAAINAVGALDHPELKLKLWALKEEWRRTVRAYVRELEQGAAQRRELTHLHGVVANMRANNEERALPRHVRIERSVKRVLAKHGPLTRLAVDAELPDAS